MLSEYAYAKLQCMQGREYFLRYLPAIISSKRNRQQLKTTNSMQHLPITQITSQYSYHAIIYYHKQQYKILAISTIIIDGQILNYPNQYKQYLLLQPVELLNKFINGNNKMNYQNVGILKNISKIIIQNQQESQVYYFCKSCAIKQRNSSTLNTLNCGKSGGNGLINFNQKILIDNPINGTKWSVDDHQQLKKLLLQYGYGRWKQIQRSALIVGGKLDNKPLIEIKAYANSFLRALGLSLPQQETNLKIFLQKLIQENSQQYQQFQPNLKQWDQHIMLPQRSAQYTKRLQLLYRVKNLVRKYRQDAMKNMIEPDRRKINWDGLLNFIPLGLLFGQRPAVWWAKKNDIDLVLGVYKYGYANYVSIRNAKQYCFAELEKARTYQDFPVADNLTRRLKKLINTIMKIQQNQGEIDFQDQAQSEQDQKSWNDQEKKTLFMLIMQYGVPLGQDNRSNWGQIRDKIKLQLKDFSKTPSQVEKMVSRLRWNCQELISDEKMKDQGNQGGNIGINSIFKITYENAVKFIKNINILEFIRRSILTMQGDNLKLFFKEIQERTQNITKNHQAYIEGKVNDQILLNYVNKNGIIPYLQLKINENKILARMQWICQIYKIMKQKLQDKKKKYKTFDQSTKKKAKFQLNRDKDGNIKFPININPSLILVATGQVCILPNYHSQHNLFPIGYVSIRTHASMFVRGQRAKYTCQILQGDNKPIYRVTSQQDPSNPICKDSSTGCWVYICNRVNQLQQVKKEKVTISGTERFGLLEQNVVRLLEDLTNASKCAKYKFKKNIPTIEQQ